MFVFLEGDHFFPFLLSHIANLFDRHYAYLLNVMVYFLHEQWLLLHLNFFLPFFLFPKKGSELLRTLLGCEYGSVLVDEIDTLIGRAYSYLLRAHNNQKLNNQQAQRSCYSLRCSFSRISLRDFMAGATPVLLLGCCFTPSAPSSSGFINFCSIAYSTALPISSNGALLFSPVRADVWK